MVLSSSATYWEALLCCWCSVLSAFSAILCFTSSFQAVPYDMGTAGWGNPDRRMCVDELA